jgi:hypothetical protein
MLFTEPVFYILAIPAVFIFGISKGGFGGGLGILAVPLLSLIVSPVQAASVLLPVLCVIDLIGLRAYRWRWDILNLKILIPGAVAGIITGALLFRFMSPEFFKLLLGIISILFSLDYFYRRFLRLDMVASKAHVIYGSLAGAVAGFTSFIAHAGGPPITMYLLPQRMHPTRFVATTVLLFTVINYLKLIPYGWLGLLGVGNLLTSFILLPFACIGFYAGIWLHSRIPQDVFYRICYLLLFIVGLKLISDGLGVFQTPFIQF